MELSHDMYEYLANFADDRTILNMLSVNRTYNNPILFQRIFHRKYPFLSKYKTTDESWKDFYVSMIYYIEKLKEDYAFRYPEDIKIGIAYVNPRKFYLELKGRPPEEDKLIERLNNHIILNWMIDDDIFDFVTNEFPEAVAITGTVKNGLPGILMVVPEIKRNYPSEITGLPLEISIGHTGH